MLKRIHFCFILLWPYLLHAQTNTKTLTWDFPLRRTHAGILLGNGTQGLMVWGENNQLNITIGRAGFWDHRGGNDFSARTTFQEVKKLLQAGDEEGIKKAFAVSGESPGSPHEPQQIGGGRLEIKFPENYKILKGVLDLDKAEIKIQVESASQKKIEVIIEQSTQLEVAWVKLPPELQEKVEVNLVPSWAHIAEALSKVGVKAPEVWTDKKGKIGAAGFCQYLPEDDPLAIAYTSNKNDLIIASYLGKDAAKKVKQILSGVNIQDLDEQKGKWWEAYWTSVPKVNLPDAEIQEIFNYGLYKQACSSPPEGVACTLQGPFNEEYQLPPWSNDYHFNINIQMIYWPALASNRLEHFDPLWKMIKSWWPQLQSNGENFFGRKGAIMLPHAVDDRCHVVGTFWTGTIDHACTAWMAQMAWMHYKYSMDERVLREVAWPLLTGAFEGYWAMLEEEPDGNGGKRFSLPVSVSPEFKGSRMDAWGKNASFQLAALHRIAEILPEAAQLMKATQDSRWKEVSEKLPDYTLVEGTSSLEYQERKVQRIALWEGMDLIESHRHHSHLGALYPFCTIDPTDPQRKEIVQASLSNWITKGAGKWTGWCVPWASIIWLRNNNADAAIAWLHWWKDNFTNEGRGTLHDVAHWGTSVMGGTNWRKLPPGKPNREIMQLDAGFGALNAVFELLVQQRKDITYVLPSIPVGWKKFDFENIRTEGAFLVSGKVEEERMFEVRIKSLKGGKIKLAHGLGLNYQINGQDFSGNLFEKEFRLGEEVVLKRK